MGADPSGWYGELGLGFELQGQRTRLRRRFGRGPLYVQKPFYPEGAPCHVYLLHPPGGIAGGDELHVDVIVGAGATALLTTPAAGKFYRSEGRAAQLTHTLTVADDASLEWLPQETLLFGGCNARITTQVSLAPEARFIGWDLVCLGRAASGDSFASGRAELRLRIDRKSPGACGPRLLERTVLAAGDVLLDLPWGLAGRRVLGTLYATPADADVLAAARRLCPPLGPDDTPGALTLVDDVLVYRVLDGNSEGARTRLTALWSALRPLLLKRPACPPRIWNT